MAQRSSLSLSRSSVRAVGALLAGVMLCGTAACSPSGGGSRERSAKPEKLRAAPVAAVLKAVDKGAKLNSVSYRINGELAGQGTVEGKVSLSLRPRAADMRMKLSGGRKDREFSLRLIGDTVYLSPGERMAAMLHGKHWLKLQMPRKGAGGAGAFGGMQRQADQDPTAQASLLTQSGDIRKIGAETVDGVRTTHYAGTVSLERLLKLKRPHAKDGLSAKRRERAIERYKALGVKKLKLDLWIGPDDRTVKFRERARTIQGPLDLNIHFFGVNKPVTVQAPPASDTVDLMKTLKQGSGPGFRPGFRPGSQERFEGREGARI